MEESALGAVSKGRLKGLKAWQLFNVAKRGEVEGVPGELVKEALKDKSYGFGPRERLSNFIDQHVNHLDYEEIAQEQEKTIVALKRELERRESEIEKLRTQLSHVQEFNRRAHQEAQKEQNKIPLNDITIDDLNDAILAHFDIYGRNIKPGDRIMIAGHEVCYNAIAIRARKDKINGYKYMGSGLFVYGEKLIKEYLESQPNPKYVCQ